MAREEVSVQQHGIPRKTPSDQVSAEVRGGGGGGRATAPLNTARPAGGRNCCCGSGARLDACCSRGPTPNTVYSVIPYAIN